MLHRPTRRRFDARARAIARAIAIVAVIVGAHSRPVTAEGATSDITVDFKVNKRVVPPFLFGQNMQTIENGESVIAGDGGLDPEMVGLLTQARITSLRFPGGTPADYFHWWQAIGLPSRRPLQASGNLAELYRPVIGPEEFMRLALALRAVPLITANSGTGGATEAEAWATYFNSVGFPVQFWEVGNEPYFTGINENGVVGLTPDAYAARFIEYASKIRAVVPDAKVFAAGLVGPDQQESFWNSVMLGLAGPYVDGLSLHNAYAPLYGYTPERTIPSDEYLYTAMLGATQPFERSLENVRDELARRGRLIPIFVTEYDGIFFPDEEIEPAEVTLARNPTLACALYNASIFHVMMRNDRVHGAYHMSLAGRYYGSLIGIDDSKRFFNPQFYVHREYAREADNIVVDAMLDPQDARFDSGAVRTIPAQTGVPMLDVIATRKPGDDYHALFVVNRSLDEAVLASVTSNLPDDGRVGTVSVLTGPSHDARNDAANPLRVALETRPFDEGGDFTYSFPPHSLTIFRWRAPDGMAYPVCPAVAPSTTTVPVTTSTTTTTTPVPVTISTTTTTTPVDTTTKTTLPVDACAIEAIAPTFRSVACRFAALIEQVSTSTELGPFRKSFKARLEKAGQREKDAEASCREPNLRQTKTILAQVLRKTSQLAKTLRSRQAKRSLPQTLRNGMRTTVTRLGRDLRLLRKAVRCPDGVVTR